MHVIEVTATPRAWTIDDLLAYLTHLRDRFGGGITNPITIAVRPDEEGIGASVTIRDEDET